MVFRHRGIKVVVDTTDTAEFDIQGYQLTVEFLQAVERNFTSVPFSDNDICEGSLRARTIDDYDFFFIVGRLEGEMVVTIGGIQPHESEAALHKALKIAEKIVVLRGAAGV